MQKHLKILIISTFFPPSNSIAALRPYSLAKYWKKEGHEIAILTTKKNIPASLALSFDLSPFHLIEVPLPSFTSSAKKKYHSSSKKKNLLFRCFDFLRFKKGGLQTIIDLNIFRAVKNMRYRYQVVVRLRRSRIIRNLERA